MGKLDLNKVNLSGAERFVRKYLVETLTGVAVAVAAFSSWTHLFMGTLGASVLFLMLGSLVGLFFSAQMDLFIKKVYGMSKGKQSAIVIAELVKIGVALFLPFVYFAFFGILSGTAYQYYIHRSHLDHGGQ